jgi:hypothetical protein
MNRRYRDFRPSHDRYMAVLDDMRKDPREEPDMSGMPAGSDYNLHWLDLEAPGDVAGDPYDERRRYFVDGFIADRYYQIAIVAQPAAERPTVEGYAADRVLAMLEVNAGAEIALTATGPVVEVSTTKPIGVLAGLREFTRIVDEFGDLPAGYPRDYPGVVH